MIARQKHALWHLILIPSWLGLASAAVPDYQIYSGDASNPAHPRVFFRNADKAALRSRTTDVNNWQAEWSVIRSWCNNVVNDTNDSLVNNSPGTKLAALAFAGWIDNNVSYKNKAIDAAVYLAGLTTTSESAARDRTLALAFVYDTLFNEPEMSDAERTTIGRGVLAQLSHLGFRDDEHIAGHSKGNQCIKFVGAAAVANDVWSGATNNWRTYADQAMNFWYEDNIGYIETVRHYCRDGGHLQGSWYTTLITYHDMLFFTALANATTNVNPFTQESWVSKIPEWFLNTILRGDDNMLAYFDTARTSNPFFQKETHMVTAVLADRFQNRAMRWIYDHLRTKDSAYGPNLVYDVFLMDKTKVAPLAPSSWTYPKSRLFNPPGTFFYRNTWDYANATVIHINAEQYYTMVHQHLDVGSMQIAWKDDMVLLAPTGVYADSNFGEAHHRNWHVRSIGHSGVPLIYRANDFYERWSDSGQSDLDPDNDGGQHWKKFDDPSGLRSIPYNIVNLLTDGGGQAWNNAGFTTIEETADYVFLHADIEKAYRKRHTDSPRTPVNEIRWLVLKNAGPYPMVLAYHRIQSANSAWPKTIPWHFGGSVSVSSGRITGNGAQGTGKCVIDVLDPQKYRIRTFGPNNYTYSFGAGNSWPPDAAGNDRHRLDWGGWRAEVSPATLQANDEIVSLVMPMGVSESAPSYTWINETDWYGVRINGHEYRIHKTLRQATRDGSVTPPPASPTGIRVR